MGWQYLVDGADRPGLYCGPRMAQNGTTENGVAEGISALPFPQPVKVQEIRHTKVREHKFNCCRYSRVRSIYHNGVFDFNDSLYQLRHKLNPLQTLSAFHRFLSTMNGTHPAVERHFQLSTQRQVSKSVMWKKQTK